MRRAGQFDAHRILSASARKAHSSPSPRNWGTRKKRSLAYDDSTTPRKVASASTLAAKAASASPISAGEVPGASPSGKNSAATSVEDDELLGVRRQDDAGETGPRVLEQHALVEHGELEVGIRVVHRNAPGLGQGQHEHGEQREQVGRLPRQRRQRAAPRGQLAQVGGAARDRDREDHHHQGRLDQQADRHLARGAHAAEGPAGVERPDGAAGNAPAPAAPAAGSRRPGAAAPGPPAPTAPGSIAAAVTVAASTSTGMARKNGLAVSLCTVPLRSSLARSRYGCHTLAPCRHCRRALSFWMKPVTSGPSSTSSPAWAAFCRVCAVRSMAHPFANKQQRHHQRDQHEADVAVDAPGAVGADAMRAGGDPALEPRVEHGLGEIDHLAGVADAG